MTFFGGDCRLSGISGMCRRSPGVGIASSSVDKTTITQELYPRSMGSAGADPKVN
jgi:hypothetical protein